jgi:hypothetical protein
MDFSRLLCTIQRLNVGSLLYVLFLKNANSAMTKDERDASQPARATKSKGTPLDRHVQAHIGRKLKAMYDEVASEPLPDRLVELLSRLNGKGE